MTQITTVQLGAISLNCIDIEPTRKPNVVSIDIPERADPIFQHIGWSATTYTLKAILSGANKETTKATLEGYRDTAATVSYSDGETSMTVIIDDIIIPHRAARDINMYDCVIVIKKYNQT